jgi:osmoprotectant transport system permease protein
VKGLAAWLSTAANWTGEDGVPHRVLQHLGYTALALLIAAAVALPLGLWIGHTGRLAFLVVNVANAGRALPTLGLLILLVALVGTGQTPVLVALVLLAIPPILVNTFEGIRSVEPSIPAAARSVGMHGSQVLFRAEVPSALPAILLGLRTAAIQVVSTATVAAYVGLGGVGRFIIDGLARLEYDTVIAGAVLVALLAVLTEALFTAVLVLVVSPGVRRRA